MEHNKCAYMCSALTKINLSPEEWREVIGNKSHPEIRRGFEEYVVGRGFIAEAEAAKKERLKRFLERLAGVANHIIGTSTFIPHKHFDPDFSKGATPQEVRAVEGGQIKEKTCLVIAILDEPTTGGGIELGWAEDLNIPVIILSKAPVSRLPRGLHNIEKEIIYREEDQAIQELESAIPQQLWCEAYRLSRVAV